MPIQKLTVEQFLQLANQYPVLDVRSPGEYSHAHVPNAVSLPLFTDEERKVVGTAYKQQSKQTAIKLGLDYFGGKMRKMVEEVEALVVAREALLGNAATPNDPQGPADEQSSTNNEKRSTNIVLVHCWRGGMRSAGVAWLLDLYGFKVYTLIGGYKAYRKWVLAQFEKNYPFKIIGGFTGSGKTLVLHQLAHQKKDTIDLEGLAHHKGSAFGALGEAPQPTQEMFENLLAERLADNRCSSAGPFGLTVESSTTTTNDQQSTCIWLEDESQRIGNLIIPMPLWHTMRKSPVYFLDVPFEERLQYITKEYGSFTKEQLVNAIIRIQKRLGGLETKNAINYLLENNFKACFGILLTYYDKQYNKGLLNRENVTALLNKIPCSGVDTTTNTQNILACLTVTV